MKASNNNGRAMQAADVLLMSSSIVLSFIVVVGGMVTPMFFEVAYRIKTTKELADFLPSISNIAFHNSWWFAAMLILISIVGIIQLHKWPSQILKFTILNLCLQAFVFWGAMFCYFYNEFLGSISMHHEPAFSLESFIGFCCGIFPVSLIAILSPIPFALTIKEQVSVQPS